MNKMLRRTPEGVRFSMSKSLEEFAPAGRILLSKKEFLQKDEIPVYLYALMC